MTVEEVLRKLGGLFRFCNVIFCRYLYAPTVENQTALLATKSQQVLSCNLYFKLDGVGPIDKRPSTDKLQHLTKIKIIIIIVTCDT